MRRAAAGLAGAGMALLLQAVPVPARAADHAVVFVYHRFGDSRYPSTNTPVAAFKAQLDYLAANGFHVWSLPRLVATMSAGRQVPPRTVVLSVDDAFQSVYAKAWPLLEAHHFPVTVFVSTEAVDRHYPDYMTWAEMRRMADAGATFADHTVSHPHMLERLPGESPRAWASRMRKEIEAAQRRLQAELGAATDTHPKLFAYPYGEYDPALAKILAGLGYVAFSQRSGALGEPLDPRALPRFPIDTDFDSLQMFARRARSRPLPVAGVSPWSPVVGAADNPPVLVLELARPIPGIACYREDGSPIPASRSAPSRVRLRARTSLPVGRSLYTCTAPTAGGGYYWYTHPWFRMPRD